MLMLSHKDVQYLSYKIKPNVLYLIQCITLNRVPLKQVNPVFEQSVAGLGGQREGTVLVVWDARVSH